MSIHVLTVEWLSQPSPSKAWYEDQANNVNEPSQEDSTTQAKANELLESLQEEDWAQAEVIRTTIDLASLKLPISSTVGPEIKATPTGDYSDAPRTPPKGFEYVMSFTTITVYQTVPVPATLDPGPRPAPLPAPSSPRPPPPPPPPSPAMTVSMLPPGVTTSEQSRAPTSIVVETSGSLKGHQGASSEHVAPIVGGVLGGLALAILFSLGLVWVNARTKRPEVTFVDAQQDKRNIGWPLESRGNEAQQAGVNAQDSIWYHAR